MMTRIDRRIESVNVSVLTNTRLFRLRSRRLRMTLRLRLTLWFSGVLAVILVGVSWAVFAGAQHILLTETDGFLDSEAQSLAASLNGTPSLNGASGFPPDPDDVRAAMNTLGSRQGRLTPGPAVFDVVYARLVLQNSGLVLAVSPDLARRPAVAASLNPELLPPLGQNGRHAFVGPDMDGALRVRTIPIHFDGKAACLQVAVPWVHNDDLLDRLCLLLALGVPLVLILTTVGGWLLVQRTLQPISRIVTEAEHLDAAALPEALLPEPTETDSEIGLLVSTLNRMTTRLHDAFEAQRRFAEAQQRFAADASHELRTPLTILRGEMELALSRARTSDEYRETLTVAVEEIARMSRIVEGLGFLARQDAGRIEAQPVVEELDLVQIAQAVIAEFRRPARAKGIALRFGESLLPNDTLPGVSVKANADHLLQLVRNLVENAIKYTPPGGVVLAACSVVDKQARLCIQDTGVGITPEDLPRVFERFWRADKSRASEGSGLGLAICIDIARTYGGHMEAQSTPDKGSRFLLWLPLA
jgi:signal transduction histidine kinase